MNRKFLVVCAFALSFMFNGCGLFPGSTANGQDLKIESYNALIQTVKPALVRVESINPEGLLILMYLESTGLPLTPELARKIKIAAGSGFIIDSTGIVITNRHVVRKGWHCIVRLLDGRAYTTTSIVVSQKEDIAVIKLAKVEKALPTVSFSKQEAKMGDIIFTIGRSPSFDLSFKTGVVSSVRRSLGRGKVNMQMTIPVNPGESGSAVFNTKGEIIGVVRAYIPSLRGISLAVLGTSAEKVIKQLRVRIEKEEEKAAKEKAKTKENQGMGDFHHNDGYMLLRNYQGILDRI